MRGKGTVQISALNTFIGSLALSALWRMEPMLQKICDFVRRNSQGELGSRIISVKYCITSDRQDV